GSTPGGSQAVLEEIAAGDERTNLPVDHGALQHPEPAVGMDVLEAFRSDGLDDPLDARRDQLRALDLVVLDVDDADPEREPRIEIVEHLELVVAAPRELE